MLTEIVTRALRDPICNIGQLTPAEKYQLNTAVKRGVLSKGRGGPFPRLKTMYARPGFDFAADRQREVDEAMVYAEWESRHGYELRGRCLNLNCRHGREGENQCKESLTELSNGPAATSNVTLAITIR